MAETKEDEKLEEKSKAKKPSKLPEHKEDKEALIEKTNAAAERLEAATAKAEAALAKSEEAKTEAALGGEANAGTKEQTQDEKDTEGAKELLNGTGLEDHAFPAEEKA